MVELLQLQCFEFESWKLGIGNLLVTCEVNFRQKIRKMRHEEEVVIYNELTILDYLNEDCWRAVLDYVPVKDIICSERVSSHWQRIVLLYLSHMRFLITYKDHYQCLGVPMEIPNVTSFEVDIDDWPSFLSWTNKLGSSVVGIHCTCLETLKTIGLNCPKLEGLGLFYPLTEKLLQDDEIKNFKFLRKLGLTFIDMSDQCLNQFINCTVLEELFICNNEKMTGECLNNMRLSNIKSLILDYCPELKLRHLVSAVDHFNKLTKLVLADPTTEIHDNANILVDKLPNLEYLHYVQRDEDLDFAYHSIGHFFKSVCGLGRLKHLYVHGFINDYDLDTITRCCKELHSLELEECDVTPNGLWSACQNAGERLTTLSLDGCDELTDDAIVACIRSCPNLTSLSVRNIRALTLKVISRAEAARREVHAPMLLRIFVHGTKLYTLNFPDRVASEKEIIIDHSLREKWW
ncbi:uncharacterized protein LOC133527549 isoform X2 [Cydia pomonella]|uniref:uncharacterized protein LOC133527549 isoform X2 n=1 Tax=Cydia pomonella TaxID=82600 RepID=UPI002ADD4685|nr:uncharacterized protein LOC133527549 isoform X2 [Cydia pomonella]